MPSAFESSFASNLDPIYSAFGLLASYTAPSGAVVSTGIDGAALMVRVHRGDVRPVERAQRANGELQTAELLVRQSQVSKVVKGGRFKVEGAEVWTVENTPTLKNGEHVCTCSRSGIERLAGSMEKAQG